VSENSCVGDLQIRRLAFLFARAVMHTWLQICSFELIPGLLYGERGVQDSPRDTVLIVHWKRSP